MHTIILINGLTTDEQLEVLTKKNITIFNKPVPETCSEDLFNGSKVMGTLCLDVHSNKTLALPNAQEYVSKKGDMGSILYNLTKRLIGTKNDNYNLILLNSGFDFDPKKELQQYQLLQWATKNAKVMTLTELDTFNIPENKCNSDIKVTCGLMTKHEQDNQHLIGHSTKAYGISLDEQNTLYENNAMNFGKTFDGHIIHMTFEDDKGLQEAGDIVFIPDLVPTAHITVKSLIKAVLSSKVVDKYKEGVFNFYLKDIDKDAKQNPKIIIAKTTTAQVHINGWYCYAIESK